MPFLVSSAKHAANRLPQQNRVYAMGQLSPLIDITNLFAVVGAFRVAYVPHILWSCTLPYSVEYGLNEVGVLYGKGVGRSEVPAKTGGASRHQGTRMDKSTVRRH